jgi:6-pyruvoyltetrahydropterin/6-carboxytetrahydropterin synthase
MWTLSKKFTFEASHQLPKHNGKCARLHGHSWVGWIHVEGNRLGEANGSTAGMLIDYGTLSALIKPIVEEHLDHYHLNDSLGLANPTSEEIARWLYNRLKPVLPMLVAVEIEETCTSKCRYQPTPTYSL